MANIKKCEQQITRVSKNIKEEIKEIPKVDEELLANQKFIDLDDLDSDSYWKNIPQDQGPSKDKGENQEELNKEWQEIYSSSYNDNRLPQDNSFYSFEYDESNEIISFAQTFSLINIKRIKFLSINITPFDVKA